MLRCVALTFLAAVLPPAATASSFVRGAIPAIADRAADLPPERNQAARLQTLLARAGYSPGLIDGKPGRKTRLALEHFQRASGLTISSAVDESTLASLASSATGRDGEASQESWTRPYRISSADLALVTGPIPQDWNERAKLEVSGYEHLTELLAERGWCSQELVTLLNPGVTIDSLQAGDVVTLPDVPELAGQGVKTLPRIARIEVDLAEKLVLGFDANDHEVAMLHCSIAQHAEKRPVGDLVVQVVVTDPDYTFDPAVWPEVDNVTKKLRIAPGPRNPVGVAWIGLDRPGYGLHGTVKPQDIGKTGSHGCFRLANWDAARLAKAVRVGTLVQVRE